MLKLKRYIITFILITAISFLISCSPGKPEINIKQGSQDIETNGSFDFGIQEAEITNEKDFTIENLGEGELELTGIPFVRIEGTDSDSFSITSEPVGTIAGGESTTFTIGYTPQSDGSKSASVYIESNDEDESTYQFSLTGDAFLSGTEDTENWDKIYSNGNSDSEIIYAMAVDSNDNIYAVGTGSDDWWIKKFDSDGNEDTTNWNLMLDGNGDYDVATDIAIDDNGNIYIVGIGTNLISTNSGIDWWIKKFDSNGNEDTTNWDKMYDGTDDYDPLYGVEIDSSGSIYVAGAGYNLISSSSADDWWIKKFNSDGSEDTTNWNKMIDGNDGLDIATSIIIDSNDDIYVTGVGTNIISSTSDHDMWIKKFNSNGNEYTSNWNKMFDGNDSVEEILDIAVDNNDNIYIAGHGDNIVSGSSGIDWWIKKFSSDGNEDTTNWNKMFNGNDGDDLAYNISISNESVYIAGYGGNIVSGSSGIDWWIKKFDIDGNEDTTNWNKMIDGNNNDDQLTSSRLDSEGNLYVGGIGVNIHNSTSDSDWWIKKFLD